jgi:hypothetical protein
MIKSKKKRHSDPILASTVYGVNPMIPHPDLRPRCQHPGCVKEVMIISTLKDGSPNYRKWCSEHHSQRTAAKHGLKTMVEVCAKNAGFGSVKKYINSRHKDRRWKKDYCENKDGRLGYVCDFKIQIEEQLEVDHIDGNPYNESPDNYQTLCCNCHSYKTWKNRDHLSPGRTTIKNKKKNRTNNYFLSFNYVANSSEIGVTSESHSDRDPGLISNT